MTNYKLYNGIFSFINRLLITSILVIFLLISFKKNNSFKSSFYDKFLSTDFNFSYVNDLYKKYFGSPIPFSSMISEPVFDEKIVYDGYSEYLDGVSLNVGADYMVPIIHNGLVVFIGEKDGYGNTVIVKDSDGVDVWYSNLSSVGVKMYEYVSSGSFIGGCSDNLYLVFKKDGNVLDFKKFI